MVLQQLAVMSFTHISCYLAIMWPGFVVVWQFGQIAYSYVTSPFGLGLMVGA
jgi:hypothetical protein